MGEYADDYFRKEVASKHGFDPGSMYAESGSKKVAHKTPCPHCGKRVKAAGLKDHMRDVHEPKVCKPVDIFDDDTGDNGDWIHDQDMGAR